MSYRISVKPSKAVSAVGLAAGSLFVVLGITTVVPLLGFVGVVWTVLAGALTAFCAAQFLGGDVPADEVNVHGSPDVEALNAALRRLAWLKQDGLLGAEEYERKRAELLR
jgi:hypothetical protein